MGNIPMSEDQNSFHGKQILLAQCNLSERIDMMAIVAKMVNILTMLLLIQKV